MASDAVVTVVGIGADGWAGLSERAREAVGSCDVLWGSPRQLHLVPPSAHERVPWPSPLLRELPALLAAHADRRVCVLASGDPMLYGIGSTLERMIGADRLHVVPHVSCVALACARLGWAADSVDVVSVVARPLARLNRAVLPGRRVLVLTASAETPAEIAALLRETGYGPSRMVLLEDLDGPAERVTEGTARGWDLPPGSPLNVVALECRPAPAAPLWAPVPGLPDDAFEHDGQLTKREVRAVTLARLGPLPGELLWDVGAGAGSVGIEWMRSHPACEAIAVEHDAERCARIGRNAARLGVPTLRVVTGRAPEALAGLRAPDAVFVGGGASDQALLAACWNVLAPGGRLVVNAVTVQAQARVVEWQADRGGDLVRLSVERIGPVGGFTVWRPALPVVQWAAVKP